MVLPLSFEHYGLKSLDKILKEEHRDSSKEIGELGKGQSLKSLQTTPTMTQVISMLIYCDCSCSHSGLTLPGVL